MLVNSNLMISRWVLADRILIPRLQNAAIHKIEEICLLNLQLLSPRTNRYIYQNTAGGNVLRIYAVDSILNLSEPDWLAGVLVDIPRAYPPQMIEELLVALLRRNATWKRQSMDMALYEVVED